MAAGAGILLYTTVGVFLCLPSVPFDINTCVALSTRQLGILASAGFDVTVLIGATTLGGIFYYISGKWKRN